jgi:UDP-N-acetylmuramate: L-alanyl-gamma-D-glutamyl-meso-diaminopimelate ligase
MKIHLIAIGGSAMHNMALALHEKGYEVSGSDDEIFEPSKGRLAAKGLLPEYMGWNADRVTSDIDAVILGMHARENNPELKKAQDLGLKIFSYPEYIFEQSKDKIRVVIGGSHGKTTITSMVLHVMNELNMNVDYMVGAKLEGYETMVKLTKEAKYIVLEGDEYLSSPIDRRPKFHLYKPHIAMISGIAWDHINVFPTFENYVEQFEIFANSIADKGDFIYCSEDKEVVRVANKSKDTLNKLAYGIYPHRIEKGITILDTQYGEYEISTFGDHNLMNLNAARLLCMSMGVEEKSFYEAIQSFTGASKRLEKIAENENSTVYKDFAHSPSKLKATTAAVKKQFDDRKLIACMELHTFSSLNKEFLKQYKGAMETADEAIVFFSPKAIEHKKLEQLDPDYVLKCFASENVEVITETEVIERKLKTTDWKGKNLLLMTSGNFGGIDLDSFASELVS